MKIACSRTAISAFKTFSATVFLNIFFAGRAARDRYLSEHINKTNMLLLTSRFLFNFLFAGRAAILGR